MKQELSKQTKFNIRVKLYPLIQLMLERGYKIRMTKDGTTRLAFKDKESTMDEIYSEIRKFAIQNGASIALVKDYLLTLVEISKEQKPLFNQEHVELMSIISQSDTEIEK